MEMDTRKVNFGFDTGISSAGWSVVDANSGEIIEAGVRLFKGADAARNTERREFRQSRRLIRRRSVRIKDAKELLKRTFHLDDIVDDSTINPYVARVKGLTEELTTQELIQSLLHIIKRRGISYDLGDLEDEDGTSGSDFKESIDRNRRDLQTKTPGEIQLERLKEYGEVRGQVIVEDQNDEPSYILRNTFPMTAYADEARRIMETQKQYHPEITDEFIDEVLALIQRKRKYFEGPGSEKSRTDYGIYRTNGETLDNLFETLIGKDKFFPDEYRAATSSYTAQLYNLLNDLNHLRITSTEDQHLTPEHKDAIIEELRTTKRLSGGMLKLISKVTGTPKEEIRGYRIDEKDKPDLHSLNSYRKARNKLLDDGIDIKDWPTELLDDIAPIATLNTELAEIRQQLKERVQPNYPQLSDEVVELIVENHNVFVGESNNKWHRFSIKMMKELIPEMLVTSKEQSTILVERGFIKKETGVTKKNGDIDINVVLEEIYNPVVSKSVREMLKVFNALVKKYPNVDTVVIEMPRDKNADEAKKRKDAAMKANKKKKAAAVKEFMEAAGINDAQYERAVRQSRQLPTKVRLWWEQDGYCPYSGNKMRAIDVLADSQNSLFEIDHIIPQSISFDDSLANKVLCEAQMNKEKLQHTPFGFMREHMKGHQSFDEMCKMIKGWKHLPANKVRNLTFMGDIDDIETRKRFINRNLVDTRYVSRVILNTFQEYTKEVKPEMKVTVIRGQFTDLMRRRMKLWKTRDTHHHHAVDASIIAMSPTLKLWATKDHPLLIPLKVNSEAVEVETSDKMPDDQFKKQLEFPKRFLDDVKSLIPQNRIKFSHQVDKKMNRKVSDATIYSTRQAQTSKDKKEETYVIGKIKNIYDVKDYEAFKKIYDKDKTKFIMYQKDPQTFAKLEKIMEEYPDFIEVETNGKVKKQAISPFELYRRENGYVTKYAKKNNGPRIVQVKYYDNKIGSHIDITPDNAKNKKVILQSLKPWRTDVYFNHETEEYELMGLKYSDLKSIQGQYGIPQSRYEEVKRDERVSDDSEFLFSLYRNDRIKVVNDEGESVELLFSSRNLSGRGYVELKPVDKVTFENKESVSFYGNVTPAGRFVKRLAKKGWKVYKVNVDVLGNPYYLEKEAQNPKNIIVE